MRQSRTALDDVLARLRDDDAERLNLVDAGVGGVQRARDRVEADLALELGVELAAKPLHIDRRDGRAGAIARADYQRVKPRSTDRWSQT